MTCVFPDALILLVVEARVCNSLLFICISEKWCYSRKSNIQLLLLFFICIEVNVKLSHLFPFVILNNYIDSFFLCNRS